MSQWVAARWILPCRYGWCCRRLGCVFLRDAGQARHEHIWDVADFWMEAVQMANVIPQERASEREQQHAAEKGVPHFREETLVELRSIPCERVQQAVERMVGVHSGVTAVTETARQDQKIQYIVEQTLLDLVEAVKIVPQKGISDSWALSKCPRTRASKVSKLSFRSRRLRGPVNRSGISKHPNLHAKTSVCSDSGAENGSVSECPRSLARQVLWSQLSLRSSLLKGRVKDRDSRISQDLYQESVEVVKNISLRNEFLKGFISRVRLSMCPRFFTRKMSRQ